MKILVVDDTPVNLLIFRKTIQTRLPEHEYRELADSSMVLETALSWQPDVILLDYQMPGLSGLEITAALRANPDTSGIPIIMITAQQSTSELRRKCLEKGVDVFLQKPVDSMELVAQIKAMLRIREFENRLRQEQLAMERRLVERSNELKQFRDFFIPLLDSFPDLIWRAGIDAKCDWFNNTWLDFTGRTMQQEVGDGWTEGIHPDDLQQCLDTYLSAFNRRLPFAMEYRLRHRDGGWRLIREHGAPFYSPDGIFMGYIGSCYDITIQRQQEERSTHSRKMEAIGILAGGVAHDFNNILTVILGYGSLLQLQMPKDSPHAEAVNMIIDSAKRASGLTQSLLAFSRKQESRKTLEPLCELLANFQKLLKRIIGEDIELTILCEDGPINVQIDRSQLEQVLMNLAINARDAMPEGGNLVIRVHSCKITQPDAEMLEIQPGEYARILFQDTGCGIPVELQPKVFDPFFTTKEIGKGSGLGLSMAYGTIRQYSGAITLESVPGKGATFTILLPLADEAIPAPEEQSQTLPAGKETILLVEDEPSVSATTSAILRQYGYTVIQAANGNEGLARFTEYPDTINLVIMDMIMPGLNGWETAELLWERQPTLPILFMSGYTDDLISNRGIDLSKVNLLMKPATPDDLLAQIGELLNR